MDDILVFGSTQDEHDQRLTAVLQRLKDARVTLNSAKCEFSKTSVTFLGQVVDQAGIYPDPKRLKAITQMKTPQSVGEVRRFLGLTNQLNKFSPLITEKSKPLKDLLAKKTEWVWGHEQASSFQAVKEELSTASTLGRYNPSAETLVAADASSFGLGAVICQRQENGQSKPIAYASRAMTATESHYAQIEKEALAITWACEKFNVYILGMKFHIQTDHKPLISLLGKKNLQELPARIQRFRMRLMKYNYTIEYVPGKELVVANTLSRSPVSLPTKEDIVFGEQLYAHVAQVFECLPATWNRLENIRVRQMQDKEVQLVRKYLLQGWPQRKTLSPELKQYQQVAVELTEENGILFRGDRVVIPKELHSEMLARLHLGHLGISKCRERARLSMWWPGMSKQIQEMIQKCDICNKNKPQRSEPLITSPLPELPWQKLATDIFTWKGSNFLHVIDYYSRYVEIARLTSSTSASVIQHLSSIFARHGIPQILFSDNGPQYKSAEFASFAKQYGFQHVTSSFHYSQSNGEAERAVQTVKQLLNKFSDPYLALLAYRTSPLHNRYSPSELLMGRKLGTVLPVHPKLLDPQLPDKETVRNSEENQK